MKIVRLLTAIAVLAVASIIPTRAAEASIITLNFTGTLDTAGHSLFGESGSAVPFNVSFTYDTSLNTAPVPFVPTGGIINGAPAGHDIYIYSAGGIIDTNLTFGTQTWTAAQASTSGLGGGITGTLFTDTDIALATPTRYAVAFDAGTALLTLGGGGAGAQETLRTGISIMDFGTDFEGRGTPTVTTSAAPVVPEPTTLLLLGTGLLGAVVSRRRGTR